ncbi:unnamed protein product [Colias eurytheme]|nr:unnamed protein product [Colias eurytheme]
MENLKKPRAEYLSSDILEENFIKSFSPFHVVQTILGSSRVDIRDRFTHVYLKALFDGYLAFQHHCRWQMLLFFTNFFLQSMLIIEFSIMALQNNAMQWLELVTLPSAIGVCLILGTVICARCEFFFREVQQTKRLCITILSQNFEGPLRTKAKTMLKMIENQPPRFSVYNMWDMNASAMLKMLNIITTLAVALLQFAFL